MSLLPSDIHKLTDYRKKLSLKLIRVQKQFTFLNDCLRLHRIPSCIRIKQHYTFSGANALYNDFNTRLLSCTIESTNEKLQKITKEFKTATTKIEELGHLPCQSYKTTRRVYKILSERHQRKLNKLFSKQLPENQYQFYSPVNLPEHHAIQEDVQLRKTICNTRKKILLQRVRVSESITFLTDCIQQKVVPKSIRIKRCHQFFSSDVLYDEFDRKLCQAILQAKQKFHNEINDFLKNIDQVLDTDLRLPWCNDECKEVQHLISKLRQKYTNKLNRLKCWYELYMPRSKNAFKQQVSPTSSFSQATSEITPSGTTPSGTTPYQTTLSGTVPSGTTPSGTPPPNTPNSLSTPKSAKTSSPSTPSLVYNFSKRKLSDSELELLLKGHRFILDQPPDSFQIKCAVQEFKRTVRLALLHEDSESHIPRFYVRSQWIPSNLNTNDINNKRIEAFFQHLEDKSLDLVKNQRSKFRIQHDSHRVLKSLRADTNIVIQAADKGQSFVILDKDYYSTKVTSMLNEPDYYKLYETPYHCQDTVDKVMQLLNGMPIPKIKHFIEGYEVQTPLFYALPKIHKSKIISQQLFDNNSQSLVFERDEAPDDLLFRPIIASTRGPTQQLARLVDALLRPFLSKVPSYIESYQHFLEKISQHRIITPGTLLCTFDIKDLYTNIDHGLATKAINYWMKTYPDLACQSVRKLLKDADENLKISNLDINYLIDKTVDAVELILDNNIFLFDGRYYKQIKGLAMGSSFAPTIANLTIGFLEIQLYEKVREKLGSQRESYVREHWYRYIDDCQLLWPFYKNDLKEFIEILKSLDDGIVFVEDIKEDKLPFLNIMLEIKGNQLELDMYYKPTHTFAYLHFKSAHPPHVKRRVPYILAKMICTIVSDEKVRAERLEEMKQKLLAREYPLRLIQDAIKLSKRPKNEQNYASKGTSKSQSRALNFRIMFNRNNADPYRFVHEQLPLTLGEARSEKFVSRKVNLLPCNLKRLLTSSKFYHRSEPPLKLPSKCHRRGCRICDRIISTTPDKNIHCNTWIDCTSRFLVYQLNCTNTECKKSSFGHIDQLKKIKICPECKKKQFKIYPFHKMNTDRVVPRKLWLDNFLEKKLNILE